MATIDTACDGQPMHAAHPRSQPEPLVVPPKALRVQPRDSRNFLFLYLLTRFEKTIKKLRK